MPRLRSEAATLGNNPVDNISQRGWVKYGAVRVVWTGRAELLLSDQQRPEERSRGRATEGVPYRPSSPDLLHLIYGIANAVLEQGGKNKSVHGPDTTPHHGVNGVRGVIEKSAQSAKSANLVRRA